MEKLEHPLWIVDFVNAILGPPVRAIGEALGYHFTGHHVIPNYLVMVLLIVAGLTVLSLIVRSRLSVENPGKLQIVLEDGVRAVVGLLEEWIGPKGAQFLPLIATLGRVHPRRQLHGPGAWTDGAHEQHQRHARLCADDVGVSTTTRASARRASARISMHFAAPPGSPLALAPIMLPIELISHLSRVMSLSLRLFGNIFGEELVILILFTLIPWLVPLPMMLLGLVTGGLQAFIFMLLSIIYLQGAVAVEHEHDEHGHDAPHGHHAPAAA